MKLIILYITLTISCSGTNSQCFSEVVSQYPKCEIFHFKEVRRYGVSAMNREKEWNFGIECGVEMLAERK